MRKRYSRITVIYLVLLTIYLLVPAHFLPWVNNPVHDLVFFAVSYGLLIWLALAALGSCPLRWRNLVPWIFIMALAHLFWLGYIQGLLPGFNRYPSYYGLSAGSVGSLAGILIRMKMAYKNCNCSLMVMSRQNKMPESSFSSATDTTEEPGFEPPVTIANFPGLNRIIAESFGWKALQLKPVPGITIDMVCTGQNLISLPHFSYGNIQNATGKSLSGKDWQNILAGFALPQNIAQMELRLPWQGQSLESHKVASWLTLGKSMEEQMVGFNSNLRRKIRKGMAYGFNVENGGIELLNDFMKIYARHLDQLGSVALSKRFFENLLKNYSGNEKAIFLLRYEGKVVGGAFNLFYKGFYENGWFATLHGVQGLYASYVLHQAMIDHAISLGCHTYSFGRSTAGGGVHRFKHQWGAADVPLFWSHYPVQKLNLRKQSWLHNIWKILPWPLRKRFGGSLAKWIY